MIWEKIWIESSWVTCSLSKLEEKLVNSQKIVSYFTCTSNKKTKFNHLCGNFYISMFCFCWVVFYISRLSMYNVRESPNSFIPLYPKTVCLVKEWVVLTIVCILTQHRPHLHYWPRWLKVFFRECIANELLHLRRKSIIQDLHINNRVQCQKIKLNNEEILRIPMEKSRNDITSASMQTS